MSTEKCFNKSVRRRRPLWWSVVPLLLRPRFTALLHGGARTAELPGTWLKNGLLALFIGILLFGVLESTTVALEGVAQSLPGYQFTPVVPLQIVFLALLVLLSLSSIVGALATFFLAKDLDLVLAAPISSVRFFLGKLGDVMILSAWFPLLFVAPLFAAVGTFFDAPALFYAGGIAVLLLITGLASATAVALVAVLAWIIPAVQTRRIFIGIGLVGIVAGYLSLQHIVPTDIATKDVGELIRNALVARVQMEAKGPTWSAALLLESLRTGQHFEAARHLGVLLLAVGIAVAGAYVLTRLLFERGLSKAQASRGLIRINSRNSQARLIKLFFFISPPNRALAAKELKLFSRDMIQALQLMVLLGLCVVYLYNFQILRAAGEFATLTPAARLWWEGALVLLNIAVSGLVTATVCMRFVFPSVSLEGQAMWVIAKAPLSPADLLRAKFWCWVLPLGTIMSVIMVCGALAVQAEPRIVAVSGLVSWIFCYGIVGMAVGLGAVFANFDWEHPAQVTASLGALLYLVASTGLVVCSMVPTAVLIILRTARAQGVEFESLRWAVFVGLASSIVVYMNVLAHRWAMKLGARALERSK